MLEVTDVVEEVVEDAPRELNRMTDRCDRCGAEAFIVASIEESVLLFCGHHGAKHMTALESAGWSVEDHRHLINEKPSISANAE